MVKTIRVNITIDEKTLRMADRAARRRKVSRSEFIRAMIRSDVEAQEREAESEARRQRQQEAIEAMDRLAHQFGDWPAEQIVRAARDRLQNSKG